MGSWHLIETLVEGVATLVASDGEVKEMTSLRRKVSPAPDIPVEPIVEYVREVGVPLSNVSPGAK
nr:GAF domain-containing protein [Rhodococcus ruber]